MNHTFEFVRFEDGARGQFTCSIKEAEQMLAVAKKNIDELKVAIQKKKALEKAQKLINNNQV